MEFLYRLKSAFLCLFCGHAAIPLSQYSTIAVGEDTLILSTDTSPKSIEVAMWAAERPEHYWRATVLGKNTYEEAARVLELMMAKKDD